MSHNEWDGCVREKVFTPNGFVRGDNYDHRLLGFRMLKPFWLSHSSGPNQFQLLEDPMGPHHHTLGFLWFAGVTWREPRLAWWPGTIPRVALCSTGTQFNSPWDASPELTVLDFEASVGRFAWKQPEVFGLSDTLRTILFRLLVAWQSCNGLKRDPEVSGDCFGLVEHLKSQPENLRLKKQTSLFWLIAACSGHSTWPESEFVPTKGLPPPFPEGFLDFPGGFPGHLWWQQPFPFFNEVHGCAATRGLRSRGWNPQGSSRGHQGGCKPSYKLVKNVLQLKAIWAVWGVPELGVPHNHRSTMVYTRKSH